MGRGLEATEGWKAVLWPKLVFSWLLLQFKRPSLHIKLLSTFLRPCLYLLRVLLTAGLLEKHYSCCITVSKDISAVRKVAFVLQSHNIKM